VNIHEAIDRLRERTHVPLLAASVWDERLDAALRGADVEDLFGDAPLRKPQMAAAAVAGLHLWNDNFDAGHNICQGISSATGAYWHGLCHRREGHAGSGLASNLGNAKYWFRQVGDHPAFDPVYRSALTVLDNAGSGFRWATETANLLRERRKWDPMAFIDWVGQAEAQTLSTETQRLLEEIQWREIDLLVDWCVREAVEG